MEAPRNQGRGTGLGETLIRTPLLYLKHGVLEKGLHVQLEHHLLGYTFVTHESHSQAKSVSCCIELL